VKLIVMVVVGGAQSIWGSVVGAMLLTILPEYLRAIEDYEVLVYGAIVILVVMFAPSGLAGGAERWLRQRRRAAAARAQAAA
jgi:branched-chain amino acid transport system permease protein